MDKWYRLDNAAKIFPVTRNSRWTNNFRVSVTLRENVDPVLLQEALHRTMPRFPNFSMTMKRGVFWYYLEPREGAPRVIPDVANPMKRFRKRNSNKFLFRVRYFNRRIALEIFHVLADGNSAMLFLKTLTAQYLTLKGYSISCGEGVLDVTETPADEEMEDAYQRYAKFHVTPARKEQRAYRPQGEELPPGDMHIITGLADMDQMQAKAKEYGVSVTELLCAVLIYCFDKRQNNEIERLYGSGGRKPRRRPVKICVPVNLRAFYPTKTFRNFVLYINPGIDPAYGTFTFEEILKQVHYYMRLHNTEKNMNAMMSTNLSSEKNPMLKAMPLFLKNIGMMAAYRMYGESRTTCTLSNIGKMTVPPEMAPLIERFDFVLNRQQFNRHAVGCVSYGGIVSVTFTSKIKDCDVERDFFSFLVKLGIHVKIESNLSRR